MSTLLSILGVNNPTPPKKGFLHIYGVDAPDNYFKLFLYDSTFRGLQFILDSLFKESLLVASAALPPLLQDARIEYPLGLNVPASVLANSAIYRGTTGKALNTTPNTGAVALRGTRFSCRWVLVAQPDE